eukprot:CAMPEP_0204362668 /NCGR_PEP_ID=MMETSP0469-20131031/39786_1 /ASSEMBLY_ACC=CAM_ASM_000384 /TAXON_ID=2969 /ORGANISM="Oxyrrhis marina" /LENGTH=47 /DNA_ID= /DNA_START= /DNA_END= /DNA_ORIENTATION=
MLLVEGQLLRRPAHAGLVGVTLGQKRGIIHAVVGHEVVAYLDIYVLA